METSMLVKKPVGLDAFVTISGFDFRPRQPAILKERVY